MAREGPRRASAQKALDVFEAVDEAVSADEYQPDAEHEAHVNTSKGKQRSAHSQQEPIEIGPPLLDLPNELILRVASFVVGDLTWAALRAALAFSEVCGKIHRLLQGSAFWIKLAKAKFAVDLVAVGVNARGKLLAQVHLRCWGCGASNAGTVDSVHHCRVCSHCRMNDKEFLMITKSNAKHNYKITDGDLKNLDYRTKRVYYEGPIRGGVWATSHLYSVKQVKEAVAAKNAKKEAKAAERAAKEAAKAERRANAGKKKGKKARKSRKD